MCTWAATSEAHGDACERACEHVRGEGKVWRQCFIAVAKVSARRPVVLGGAEELTRVLLPRAQLVDHGWP